MYDALNQTFETSRPEDILHWAVDRFMPNIAASSSFQTQSVALLHLISTTCPQLPVIFIDTGYHFPETIAFRDQLIRDLGLNVKVVRSEVPRTNQIDGSGIPMYQHNPEMCCFINKIKPMQDALQHLDAWISGIRRDQTPQRAQAQFVEVNDQGQVKINPLLNWTSKDLWRYIHQHNLPSHPLFRQGYMSIGCAPCTRPIKAGDNERDGRWAGRARTECGLHTDALSQKHTDN